MGKYKLTWKDLSWNDFKIYLFALFKAFVPKKKLDSIDDLEEETQEYYQQRIDDHFRESVRLYESLLHSGVAKECARSVLPINTVTKLYMSGTIRSWLHYVALRGDNGTQKEHMSIARSVGEILDTELPQISRAMWG